MRKAHQYCYSALKIKSTICRIKRPKVSNLMKETNFKNKITSMENAVTNTSKLVKNTELVKITEAENKMPTTSDSVKETALATQIGELK